MEAVKGSQLDRCGYPLSGLPREPPGVRAPLQLHHKRPGQHSPVHSSAVVGDPWRADSHLLTPAPPPPFPNWRGQSGGVPYGAPGLTGQQRRTQETSQAGPRAGKRSARLGTPPPATSVPGRGSVGPSSYGGATCAYRHSRSAGPPQVVPGAHPSPCVRSRGTGGQRVSVTRRMQCPGPLLPGGLSVRLPWPPHRAWSTRPHLPPTRKAQPLRPAHERRRTCTRARTHPGG